MNPYSQPLYYEIAFSFFDVKKQCDLMEKFIHKYSAISVKSVLDIACGPGLQLREFAGRGFRCIGLDSSLPMLKYLKEKAREERINIETVKADMTRFRLNCKVDFAIMMMGTISLIENNSKILSHLESVASCLKKGGLYLVENVDLDWTKKDFFGAQTWVRERDGIRVEATYDLQLKDTLTQTAIAIISLDVNDKGKEFYFEEKRTVKIVFPQEFLALIELNGKFEFLGWFEPDSTKKLKEAKEDNFVILRRR